MRLYSQSSVDIMMFDQIMDRKDPSTDNSRTTSHKSTELLRLGTDPYWLPLVLLAASDALVFAGALWLAYPIRFFTPLAALYPLREGWVVPPFTPFFHFGLIASIVGVITFERLGFYQARIGADRRIHVLRILAGVLIANLILQVILSLAGTPLSRGTRILAAVLTFLLAIAAHYLLKQAHYHMMSLGVGYQRTLLVADQVGKARSFIEDLVQNYGSQFNLQGMVLVEADFEEETPCADPAGRKIPLLGDLEDLRWLLATGSYDTALIALGEDHSREARQIATMCDRFGCDFYVAPDLFESILGSEQLGGQFLVPVLASSETPLSGSSVVVKRSFDLVGSAVLIILSLPVWIVLAILIKLESNGPVFYHQDRVGADGRTFRILKFRSMGQDAEKESGPKWASPDDPRRTRVGTWMRNWNLDETPQFINVFRGEMSLVGPRPERPHFVNQFKEEIPRYLRRHMVKSGITGWAQVNGFRGDTSIEERTRYDMWYIENWSFLLDMKILAKTIIARENAY